MEGMSDNELLPSPLRVPDAISACGFLARNANGKPEPVHVVYSTWFEKYGRTTMLIRVVSPKAGLKLAHDLSDGNFSFLNFLTTPVIVVRYHD
jgi:hypothetical protein